MAFISDKDYLIEVQKGRISGSTMVHKFGRNDGVPNGTFEIISLLSTQVVHRSSAATMRVKAGGDAADTALGAGARSVVIQGIAADLTETEETVATAGVNASAATTTAFWRVHRAWVSGVGTYGAANTEKIVIEDSAGANDMILIGVDEGQSQYAGFTIPDNVTGYLLSVHISVDAAKAADVRVMTRRGITTIVAAMPSKRLKLYWDGILGGFQYAPKGPEMVLPALTDIWIEARGGGAGTEVSADFELLLVED